MISEEIIKSIHGLVSKNVIGDKQLFNRYKGFRSELFLENYLKEKYPQIELLHGGILISINSSLSSLFNAIYFTVIPDSEDRSSYEFIYKKLSNIGFIKMYLVQYSDRNWKNEVVMEFEDSKTILPVPEINIYSYNGENGFTWKSKSADLISKNFPGLTKRKKNKYPISDSTLVWLLNNLKAFERDQLLQIYMERLFLDGYIGFGKEKGKPSDIDLILKRPNNTLVFIETKEKDLPKKAGKGFGLDIPRIKDMRKIEELTSIKYVLIVRHITNQTEREFIGWKSIPIRDFEKNTLGHENVEGGTGMRGTNTSNPTLICPYDLFSDF